MLVKQSYVNRCLGLWGLGQNDAQRERAREVHALFSKERLIYLAKLYPFDFSPLQLMMLDDQLENYIVDVRSCDDFKEVIGVGDLF